MNTVTARGTQLEQLETLALVIAEQLDNPNTDPRNIAALARQYRETINQIADLKGDEDDADEVEEIRQRQAARKS